MTLDQISQLTVAKCWSNLLDRLVDFSSLSNEDIPMTTDYDAPGDWYDQLTLHETLVKPIREEFDSELISYKNELTIEENARLAEEARKSDLIERFRGLSDLNQTYGNLGLYAEEPNQEIWLKSVLSLEDHALAETKIATLEAEDSTIEASNALVEYKKQRQGAYEDQGLTIESLIVALWEKLIENRSESADAIEAARQIIKTQFPKP